VLLLFTAQVGDPAAKAAVVADEAAAPLAHLVNQWIGEGFCRLFHVPSLTKPRASSLRRQHGLVNTNDVMPAKPKAASSRRTPTGCRIESGPDDALMGMDSMGRGRRREPA